MSEHKGRFGDRLQFQLLGENGHVGEWNIRAARRVFIISSLLGIRSYRLRFRADRHVEFASRNPRDGRE